MNRKARKRAWEEGEAGGQKEMTILFFFIRIIVTGMRDRTRVKGRKKFFLKKCLFEFSLNSWTVKRHLEKRSRFEFDCQVLSSRTSVDMVADLQLPVLTSVYASPVWTQTFVEMLTGFSDVCRIASVAKHHIDDVFRLARKTVPNVENLAIFHL